MITLHAGHKAPISGVASNGGKYIATAGYDNQLILWDAATQEPIARVHHDHLVNQCAFSPCGNFIASVSSDYTARLWSVPDLNPRAIFSEHLDDVEMIAFHPTLGLVATACRDHMIRVFTLQGILLASLAGHSEDVNSVVWLGDTLQIISSSDDGTVKRWDAQIGELIETIDMGGVQTDTVVVTSAGKIFAGNDEGEIIAVQGAKSVKTRAHNAGIKRLVLSESRGLLISMGYDRSLRIWTLGENNSINLFREAHLPSQIWPRSVAFHRDSTLVFATFGSSYACYDFETEKWNFDHVMDTFGNNAVATQNGDVFRIGDAGLLWKNDVQISALGSLCNFLCPIGEVLLSGGQLGIIFDAKSGRQIYAHRSPLNCAATFTKNGMLHVVVGTYTGEGLILRAGPNGVEYLQSIQMFDNAVKGVAISGDKIFAVCATSAVVWFSVESLELMARTERAHRRIANGCAALPGGRFASVSRDLKLRLWSAGRAEVIDTPHTNSIKCVAVSDDGRYIATGAYNGRVAVFDSELRIWSTNVQPTRSGISCLSFDGKNFLASSYDGKIYVIESSSPFRIIPKGAENELRN